MNIISLSLVTERNKHHGHSAGTSFGLNISDSGKEELHASDVTQVAKANLETILDTMRV